MKSKESVAAFLASFEFPLVDMEKIVGFLLGKGIVEKGELVKFNTLKSSEKASFDDFYEWFEGDDDSELGNLLVFLLEEQEKAEKAQDNYTVERINKILLFLANAFDLEIEEEDE